MLRRPQVELGGADVGMEPLELPLLLSFSWNCVPPVQPLPEQESNSQLSTALRKR